MNAETEAAPARTWIRWTPGSVAIGLGSLLTAIFVVQVLRGPWPHFPPTYPDSGSGDDPHERRADRDHDSREPPRTTVSR